MTKKNAFYAQSGGVTAVINASACGVIQTARKHADQIGTVYAGRNGIIGALTEDLIDTAAETDADIAALRSTPSGAFGSCRFKLKSLEANKREYARLIEVFKAHNIGYFFYNGGGDSADGHAVSRVTVRHHGDVLKGEGQVGEISELAHGAFFDVDRVGYVVVNSGAGQSGVGVDGDGCW